MRENITTLPTEVIEEIMSYSSYSDISALARTSTGLWQVAAPRVRSVVPLLTREGVRRCIQRLADDPQRATQILEVHLPKLMPRRKPLPWYLKFIDRSFIATLERVAPLTFLPSETYPELGRVFHNALCNMTRLRVLAVHSCQHLEIWESGIIIPSLREIFVYPGAESWYLWRWAFKQRSLITLRNCWKHPKQPYWTPSCLTYRGPLVFAALQTLITDPEGATEILPRSVVSGLTIQGLSKPPKFSEYPMHVAYSHWADYNPPYLYEIVRSNKRIPLRCITLSGTVDAICCVLQELESRHSLPPRVRLFFDLENEKSQRDLLINPQLSETIQKLSTLEVLEVYKRAIGPDYADPEVELATETAPIEEFKVHVWASACIMLQVIRFPSNSKWVITREKGDLFPHMVLQ